MEFKSESKPEPKSAFITGASHGIGRAIAARFARQGYRLAINCLHSGDLLRQYAGELSEASGQPCLPLVGDVSDESFVAEAFQMAERELGPIDVLVNNAGISHFGLLSELDMGEWRRVLDVNLTSVFCCCKHAIPAMVRRHSGAIVNISSVWGVVGGSCEVAYSASKGGVNAFTKALAKELAPSGVAVNAIACGAIDTRMNRRLSGEEQEALAAEIPAGRFGSPQEVASLCLAIAESPPYLTGQVISLDGGWT